MILTQEYSRVASISSLDSRAWLISPSGEIHPCGDNHEEYVYAHPEEFEGEVKGLLSAFALTQAGWIRVGVLNFSLYIESKNRLTESMLSLLQNLAKEMEVPFKRVEVHIVGVNLSSFTRDEFFTITPKDVNRRGVSQYASRMANSKTRSWMVSPQGKIHDCGGNHAEYVQEHPQEFGGVSSFDSLVESGWIRVGIPWGVLYIQSSNRLTAPILDLLQKFARKVKIHYNSVQIVIDQDTKEFTKKEFQLASLKDINRRGPSQYASRLGSRFDQVVLEAWMIESDGTVHHCGQSHDAYMWKHPEEFGGITSSLELVENHGWARVGVRLGRFFVECHKMTPHLLDVFQKLAREAKVHFDRVEIHVSHNNPVSCYFEPDEFQTISIKDINRRGVSEYANRRKRAALPHSRNHLRNVSLEDLSYPLHKAFLLLDLENKYQKMSLNEISSQLRRNETLLEDETGWTADELIRDLNQLLG